MKKNVFSIALVSCCLFGLVGCGNNSSTSSSDKPSDNSSSISSSAATSSSVASSSSHIAPSSLGLTVTCPKGAPGLALSEYLSNSATSSKVTITAPTGVVAAFTAGTQDAIIFDLNKGANFVKAGKNYRLAKVLTSGNAYVVSTGHDTNNTYDATDNIVSFGTNSLFTKIFEMTSSIPASSVSEVSDVATAYTVATTGKNNGEDVDYVILSEPFVTKALAANSSLSLKENLNDTWKTYSKAQNLNGGKGYDGFPMAGIFLNANIDTDASKADDINAFLNEVEYAASDFESNNGKNILKTIKTDSDAGTYDVASTFGMDYSTLSKVVDSSANAGKIKDALGFTTSNIDYQSFIKDVLNVDYADSIFSSYYTK